MLSIRTQLLILYPLYSVYINIFSTFYSVLITKTFKNRLIVSIMCPDRHISDTIIAYVIGSIWLYFSSILIKLQSNYLQEYNLFLSFHTAIVVNSEWIITRKYFQYFIELWNKNLSVKNYRIWCIPDFLGRKPYST